jgi:hypothetical protein
MSQLYTGTQRNVVIDIASSGDNTLIAAPSTGYIVIDFITLLPTTAVSVVLKRGSTALTGPLPLDTKQPFTFENAIHSDQGILTCLPGEAFIINLGGAVQCGGFIRYRIIN